MALTLTLKRNDTRPAVSITLQEPNPSTGVLQPVDLTTATSARLLAELAGGTTATFTSVLAITTPKTAGIVKYTPIAADTAVAGIYRCEIEVTWGDSTIETYPNDGYFTLTIVEDVPG